MPAVGAATGVGDDEPGAAVAAVLPGFRVLAAAEFGGELQVRVETTADLVGCLRCTAVAVCHDRRLRLVRACPAAARPGAVVLIQAGVAVPAEVVPAGHVLRAHPGGPPEGVAEHPSSLTSWVTGAPPRARGERCRRSVNMHVRFRVELRGGDDLKPPPAGAFPWPTRAGRALRPRTDAPPHLVIHPGYAGKMRTRVDHDDRSQTRCSM